MRPKTIADQNQLEKARPLLSSRGGAVPASCRRVHRHADQARERTGWRSETLWDLARVFGTSIAPATQMRSMPNGRELLETRSADELIAMALERLTWAKPLATGRPPFPLRQRPFASAIWIRPPTWQIRSLARCKDLGKLKSHPDAILLLERDV